MTLLLTALAALAWTVAMAASPRHGAPVRQALAPALTAAAFRALAWALLLVSVGLAVVGTGWARGLAQWLSAVTVAGAMAVAVLALRPGWARPWVGLNLGLGLLGMTAPWS